MMGPFSAPAGILSNRGGFPLPSWLDMPAKGRYTESMFKEICEIAANAFLLVAFGGLVLAFLATGVMGWSMALGMPIYDNGADAGTVGVRIAGFFWGSFVFGALFKLAAFMFD